MLLLIAAPVILQKRYVQDIPRLFHDLKNVSLALHEFAGEYGRFPDATTIQAVQKNTGTKLSLGDRSSNELFRQLFAAGHNSEKTFWTKTSFTPRKPDDVLGEKTLLPGECSFSYVSGLSPRDPADTPLVIAGAVSGTWRFDAMRGNNRAVVLFVDGSVKSYPLDKDGNVMLNGMNFFDPRQPHWHGKAPDLKWPE